MAAKAPANAIVATSRKPASTTFILHAWTRKESRETRPEIVIIPRRYGADAKISIVFQRSGILSRHRLPGIPAVCYRPRLGDDGMMTSKISRIIAPVILLLSGPALAQPDAQIGVSVARAHCATMPRR